MLLTKLAEYADRQEYGAPPMYQATPIRWLIELDNAGKLLGFTPLSADDGRKNDRGLVVYAPHIQRASGIEPKLLADHGEYVLGVPREPDKPKKVKRTAACHQAFIDLTRACAEATGEPSVEAVVAFLDGWTPDLSKLPADFDPSMNLTFSVEGVRPIDLPSVCSFWAERAAGDPDGPMADCLVCGATKPATTKMQVMIKGIPGGQSSGMALVSTNALAFVSYDLSATHVCHQCGESFSNALNRLLAEHDTHLRVGPAVYAFWTKSADVGFSVTETLAHPDPEQVRKLIDAVHRPSGFDNLDADPFYAISLSASGGRVVVRDWLESTIGGVKEKLARWFALQQLVDHDGAEGPSVGLYPLAASLYRDANKEMVVNVPRALITAALGGTPLPDWLLSQAVRRNRAEQKVTRPRMVLIKMILTQNDTGEHDMTSLDATHPDAAYHCGRLLAVLEKAQRSALGSKVNATIVDRYFGAASTTPAAILGYLVTRSQSHLAHLRKNNGGAYHAISLELEEVLGAVGSSFPATLNLPRQGLFALGYYHQKAADRAAAAERRANKETATATEETN